MNKKKIRIEQLETLHNLDYLVREQKEYLVSRKLFQMSEWNKADTIGITVSKQPEIHTWEMIKRAWEEGKTVCVPKCIPKTKELHFYVLTSFTQLEKVYYDLYEPNPDKVSFIDKKKLDLILVPGLGFTKEGFRLGFGGGYYDRYLENFPGCTIALAFSEHLLKELPVEPFDVPVNKIVTEDGVINCE